MSVPIGWKKACMRNKNPAAGMMSRRAVNMNSRKTFPSRLSGMTAINTSRCGIQYQGKVKASKMSVSVSTNLVNGLRRCRKLSR